MHGLGAASPWVRRFTPLMAPGGSALDLACGGGRHLLWLAAAGLKVTGVDRDAAALSAVHAALPEAELINADLEAGAWPLAGRRFDVIVVTNYLWRPLLPALLGALAEGGLYVHETFADGHQHIGRPSRPDFLLQRGELLRVCTHLRVVAYEDGFEPSTSGGRCVQRIAAVNETAASGLQRQWPLGTPG